MAHAHIRAALHRTDIRMTIQEVLEIVATELKVMADTDRQSLRVVFKRDKEGHISAHADRVTGNVDKNGNKLVWR